KPITFQAPKTSSKAEKKVSKGKKLGAKQGLKRKQTSTKHTSKSKTKATEGGSSKIPTGSKIGHLAQETQSSSALDTNSSQPPAPTLVVADMHKEDQQAAGGPTSLGVTSEDGANPQLSSGCNASAYSTAEADPGISAPNDSFLGKGLPQ
ncbi:hypothetical protein Tco_0657268, partial [Tanacetum coccineum]